MQIELPAYISTLILISATLIPTLSWLGIERTAKKVLNRRDYLLVSSVTGLLLSIGLGTMMLLAIRGFFFIEGAEALLPPAPNVVLGLSIIVVGILLLGWRPFRQVIAAIPQQQLIGVQVYRVIGFVFVLLALRNMLPMVFALPAGLGDTATGVLAIPAAYLAMRPNRPKHWLWAWNFLGVSDLLLAITLGALSSPGEIQRLATDFVFSEFVTLSAFPLVMIPAYLVPLALVTHFYSIWKLVRGEVTVPQKSERSNSKPRRGSAQGELA